MVVFGAKVVMVLWLRSGVNVPIVVQEIISKDLRVVAKLVNSRKGIGFDSLYCTGAKREVNTHGSD